MPPTTWADAPISAFDVESTGVSTSDDRIVTACIARIDGAHVDTLELLADPGIDIPAEATAVHGVTTEHARANGLPPVEVLPVLRDELHRSWTEGRPVVIFNAPYDLSILDAELRRHNLAPLGDIGPVIDPLVLDRHLDKFRRGSRKLDAVCAHYNVRLDGAHHSTQDALAAARVAWRIAKQYPVVGEMDLDDLMQLQAAAFEAWAEHFQDYLRSKGGDDVIDPSWPIRRAPVAAAT